MMSQKPEALESPLIETKANLIIQIRQLKRNYIRQLKNLILDIYEPKNNARHAYYLMQLAVKSSQPQDVKELLIIFAKLVNKPLFISSLFYFCSQ